MFSLKKLSIKVVFFRNQTLHWCWKLFLWEERRISLLYFVKIKIPSRRRRSSYRLTPLLEITWNHRDHEISKSVCSPLIFMGIWKEFFFTKIFFQLIEVEKVYHILLGYWIFQRRIKKGRKMTTDAVRWACSFDWLEKNQWYWLKV
jgi:hypothetical protein